MCFTGNISPFVFPDIYFRCLCFTENKFEIGFAPPEKMYLCVSRETYFTPTENTVPRCFTGNIAAFFTYLYLLVRSGLFYCPFRLFFLCGEVYKSIPACSFGHFAVPLVNGIVFNNVAVKRL